MCGSFLKNQLETLTSLALLWEAADIKCETEFKFVHFTLVIQSVSLIFLRMEHNTAERRGFHSLAKRERGAKTSRREKSTLCLHIRLWVLYSDVSCCKHVVESWRTSFIPKAVPKEVKINKKKWRQSAKLYLGDSFDHLEDSFKLQPKLLFLLLMKS